jgi:hypothetical protein
LNTLLIQSQIIQKLALFPVTNDIEGLDHLKSIIAKQISIGSLSYNETFQKGYSIYKKILNIKERDRDKDEKYLYLSGQDFYESVLTNLLKHYPQQLFEFMDKHGKNHDLKTIFTAIDEGFYSTDPNKENKEFLEKILELLHFIFKIDKDPLCPYLCKLVAKALLPLDVEKGIAELEKILTLMKESMGPFEKIRMHLSIAKAHAKFDCMNKAIEAHNAAITLFPLVNRPHEIVKIDEKIIQYYAILNIVKVCEDLESSDDYNKRDRCVNKVVKTFCGLIKNESIIKVSVPGYLLLKINYFFQSLNSFGSCKLIYESFLKIIKAIQTYKHTDANWKSLKNEYLNFVLQKAHSIPHQADRCQALLSLAKEYDSFIPEIDKIIHFAICLIQNYNFDEHLGNFAKMILEIQHKFNIDIKIDLEKLIIKSIDKIECPYTRMQASLKVLSVIKKQKIFDLAIETALKTTAVSLYLAKIASLDLSQTPHILKRIKDLNLNCEQDFLENIEFT